ncbi:MAG: malectin domain-containing carbohydrate-binding protein [Cyanobacteria bacterium J06621_11]
MFFDSSNNNISTSPFLQETVGYLEENALLPTLHGAQHVGVGITQHLRADTQEINAKEIDAKEIGLNHHLANSLDVALNTLAKSFQDSHQSEAVLDDKKAAETRDAITGYGSHDELNQPADIRINVGGKDYVDSRGHLWRTDTFSKGGRRRRHRKAEIEDTQDDTLYRSKRFGKQLNYHIPVENGTYNVNLLFAETSWRGKAPRTFDIAIEDDILSSAVDVRASVGFKQAFNKEYESIVVTDGVLDIGLTGVKKFAQLSGIEVLALLPAPVVEPPVIEPPVIEQVESDSIEDRNAEKPSITALLTDDVATASLRINAGGDDYTDSLGQLWVAERFLQQGHTAQTNISILDTHEDDLYQSVRYGQDLTYQLDVVNGTYNVNMLFTEISSVGDGDRLFDISIEGQTLSSNTDIYREVGSHQAFRKEFESIVVTDGVLDIQLTGINNLAQLAGLEVVAVDQTPQQLSDSGFDLNTLLPEISDAPTGETPIGEDQNGWVANPVTDIGTLPSSPLAQRENTVYYISPNGTGDGSSWDQAARINDLDGLIEMASPGDEIWIAGDLGTYDLAGQVLVIDSGSTKAGDIYIKGVASVAGGNDTPLLVGSRAEDWAPGKANGEDVFRLLDGANHLHFSNLDFKNVGNGAFRLGGDLEGITIEDVTATNVRRFVENYVSGEAETASVTDLTIRDVEVHGFSKGAIRLQYDSNNVLIEDVFGDSQRQDGDNFAMGVHIMGTANNIVHRRVTMNNATQTRDASVYWNADGFVTESGTYDITYEDTSASGNTDGGYDLKSNGTVMIRAKASDNKRNFRIWGETRMVDIVSDDPFLRGGNGTTAHIHVYGDQSDLLIEGGTFTGSNGLESIIFDVDEQGKLTVNSAKITDDNYTLHDIEEGSEFSLNNVVEGQ